ncbi:MAG: hypothetical protein ACRAVC_22660 [Trichormus sp.]
MFHQQMRARLFNSITIHLKTGVGQFKRFYSDYNKSCSQTCQSAIFLAEKGRKYGFYRCQRVGNELVMVEIVDLMETTNLMFAIKKQLDESGKLYFQF